MFIDFTERGRHAERETETEAERQRDRETHRYDRETLIGCFPFMPDWALKMQPRCVP